MKNIILFSTLTVANQEDILNQLFPSLMKKTIAKSQEFIKLCDIMWAIMVNSRVKAGEIDGNSDEFLQIANHRIFEYENLFACSSFLG